MHAMSSQTKTAKRPKTRKDMAEERQTLDASPGDEAREKITDTAPANPEAAESTGVPEAAPVAPLDNDLIPEETVLAFTAEQEAFLAAVARVKEALPSRTTMPVLTGVWIQAGRAAAGGVQRAVRPPETPTGTRSDVTVSSSVHSWRSETSTCPGRGGRRNWPRSSTGRTPCTARPLWRPAGAGMSRLSASRMPRRRLCCNASAIA
jgi:hypothetical protein